MVQRKKSLQHIILVPEAADIDAESYDAVQAALEEDLTENITLISEEFRDFKYKEEFNENSNEWEETNEIESFSFVRENERYSLAFNLPEQLSGDVIKFVSGDVRINIRSPNSKTVYFGDEVLYSDKREDIPSLKMGKKTTSLLSDSNKLSNHAKKSLNKVSEVATNLEDIANMGDMTMISEFLSHVFGEISPELLDITNSIRLELHDRDSMLETTERRNGHVIEYNLPNEQLRLTFDKKGFTIVDELTHETIYARRLLGKEELVADERLDLKIDNEEKIKIDKEYFRDFKDTAGTIEILDGLRFIVRNDTERNKIDNAICDLFEYNFPGPTGVLLGMQSKYWTSDDKKDDWRHMEQLCDEAFDLNPKLFEKSLNSAIEYINDNAKIIYGSYNIYTEKLVNLLKDIRNTYCDEIKTLDSELKNELENKPRQSKIIQNFYLGPEKYNPNLEPDGEKEIEEVQRYNNEMNQYKKRVNTTKTKLDELYCRKLEPMLKNLEKESYEIADKIASMDSSISANMNAIGLNLGYVWGPDASKKIQWRMDKIRETKLAEIYTFIKGKAGIPNTPDYISK